MWQRDFADFLDHPCGFILNTSAFKNKELSPAEDRRDAVVGKVREIPHTIRIQ